MTKEDFVIVCGDFGLWHDNKTERWWFNWFEEKSFTVLFVDGNHENFDRLYSEFEVVNFHGGKAHKIRRNIYHLMRGYVFNIGGKKIFAFGGAASHDVQDGILDPKNYSDRNALIKDYNARTQRGEMLRINHISWWKQEMPSPDEMDFGIKTLKDNKNNVDFIVSHCAPSHVAASISAGMYKPDILTDYFETISRTVNFKKWFFGHYHDDIAVDDKFILLYDQIIRIA